MTLALINSFPASNKSQKPSGPRCRGGGAHSGHTYYTWDTTGYSQQAGATHPTGMYTC